jgi:hypothetical protein
MNEDEKRGGFAESAEERAELDGDAVPSPQDDETE